MQSQILGPSVISAQDALSVHPLDTGKKMLNKHKKMVVQNDGVKITKVQAEVLQFLVDVGVGYQNADVPEWEGQVTPSRFATLKLVEIDLVKRHEADRPYVDGTGRARSTKYVYYTITAAGKKELEAYNEAMLAAATEKAVDVRDLDLSKYKGLKDAVKQIQNQAKNNPDRRYRPGMIQKS